MQFNPKYNFYLGIAVTIEIAISHGTIGFTNAIPAAAIPAVVAWAGILAFVGSTVMTYMAAFSSAQVGPLVASPPVTSSSPKVVIALAVGLAALGLGWPGAAHAQTRLPSAAPRANAIGQPCDPLNLIPGCKEQVTSKGIDDLVSKLDTLSLPDFEFALAQAKAANNEVTQPCWSAWVDLIKARQAAALGPDGQPMPLPDPHIITAIERISELLALLRPDSKISLACVQIANVAGKDAATVLTGILSGGALGLFKLPIVPIP